MLHINWIKQYNLYLLCFVSLNKTNKINWYLNEISWLCISIRNIIIWFTNNKSRTCVSSTPTTMIWIFIFFSWVSLHFSTEYNTHIFFRALCCIYLFWISSFFNIKFETRVKEAKTNMVFCCFCCWNLYRCVCGDVMICFTGVVHLIYEIEVVFEVPIEILWYSICHISYTW